MDISNAKRIFVAGATALVISALVVGAWTRSLSAKDSGVKEAPTEQQRSKTKAVGDTLTLDEVREMIVGTWIENVAQKLGNYKRGNSKWVFTEDGTFRQYRRSESGTYELSEIHNYSVVGQYKGTQAPDDIAGYLEFTDSDGDTRYMTIESIHRVEKRPHLYVGTHGMAGNTESIYLMPPRVFD